MRWILALFLAVTACGAQAQIAGLTLPVDGRLLLWDMGAAPPRVLTAPLPSTFSAGRCYILDGNSLHVQRSAACLDYYVYRGALDPLPRLAVTARNKARIQRIAHPFLCIPLWWIRPAGAGLVKTAGKAFAPPAASCRASVGPVLGQRRTAQAGRRVSTVMRLPQGSVNPAAPSACARPGSADSTSSVSPALSALRVPAPRLCHILVAR